MRTLTRVGLVLLVILPAIICMATQPIGILVVFGNFRDVDSFLKQRSEEPSKEVTEEIAAPEQPEPTGYTCNMCLPLDLHAPDGTTYAPLMDCRQCREMFHPTAEEAKLPRCRWCGMRVMAQEEEQVD